MAKGKHYSDSLQFDDVKLSYHNWMKIAREEFSYINFFSHSFIEQVGPDYLNISGCPMTRDSEFLSELVDEGYLKAEYRDYILVTISGNYNFDILPRELKDHIGMVVADIRGSFKLPYTNVEFLYDQILPDNSGKFDIVPMTNLDLRTVKSHMAKFE